MSKCNVRVDRMDLHHSGTKNDKMTPYRPIEFVTFGRWRWRARIPKLMGNKRRSQPVLMPKLHQTNIENIPNIKLI